MLDKVKITDRKQEETEVDFSKDNFQPQSIWRALEAVNTNSQNKKETLLEGVKISMGMDLFKYYPLELGSSRRSVKTPFDRVFEYIESNGFVKMHDDNVFYLTQKGIDELKKYRKAGSGSG